MTFEPGLLCCSICDGDLEVSGKAGAILQTRCHNCGITSDDLVETQDSHQVEVYYKNNKAPANVPYSG